MTAKKNKQYCDKCYRNVNKSRLQRCTVDDCGLAHEKGQMGNNVIEFKPKDKPKSYNHKVTQPTVDEPVEEMVEIKCDAPEVGYVSAK